MAVSQSSGGSHWPAREDVQRYAESHKLQQALAEAVQTAIKERAPNGPHRVAHLLLNAAYSPSSSKGSLGDEQIEWRAKMVRDMAMGMELEIRAELAGSMLEAERCETYRALMAANALSRGDSWCSDDDNFTAALKAGRAYPLVSKRGRTLCACADAALAIRPQLSAEKWAELVKALEGQKARCGRDIPQI